MATDITSSLVFTALLERRWYGELDSRIGAKVAEEGAKRFEKSNSRDLYAWVKAHEGELRQFAAKQTV